MRDDEVRIGAASLQANKPAGLGVLFTAAVIRGSDILSEAYATALLELAWQESHLSAFITIDEDAVPAAARDADKARTAGSTAPLPERDAVALAHLTRSRHLFSRAIQTCGDSASGYHAPGVPPAVKESDLTQGLRTTFGLTGVGCCVLGKDADVVRTIKDAEGIVFGKNNFGEMSCGLTENNRRYGQVENPHRRDPVSGSSSSGSGASVAARVISASLALEGDTVGPVRVPASLCGVVGFKQTAGRWPRDRVDPISHTLDMTDMSWRVSEFEGTSA